MDKRGLSEPLLNPKMRGARAKRLVNYHDAGGAPYMNVLMIACAYKCAGVADYTSDLKSTLERTTNVKVDLLSGNCLCGNSSDLELYKCVFIGEGKAAFSIESLKGFFYSMYSNIRRYEIVHYQCDVGSFGACQLLELASLKRQKLVATAHELMELLGTGKIARACAHLLWRLILKRVDKVIVHSHYTREVLQKASRSNKIVVIPHGVFLEPSLNLRRRKITFLGYLYPRKGFLTLLQAVKILKTDYNTKIHLSVYGAYSYSAMAEVRPVIEKYGLRDSVHFGGKLSNDAFGKEISKSIFIVAPYHDSNASGVILKSMAHGTPVVATSVGSIPEYVGKAGILVQPENAQKLAEGMSAMLNDKKKRIAMGIEGLRRVREIYSWEKVALRTYELYQEILETSTA